MIYIAYQKWTENIELQIITSFNEDEDYVDDDTEIITKGETDEVDIIDDKGKTVDIQFENGGVSYNVSKSLFICMEE